jgi:hypothetical protein
MKWIRISLSRARSLKMTHSVRSDGGRSRGQRSALNGGGDDDDDDDDDDGAGR